jgi:hypothetical protein
VASASERSGAEKAFQVMVSVAAGMSEVFMKLLALRTEVKGKKFHFCFN